MNLSVADQYFLKAQSNYPYDIEDVVENLNYALSYEDDHPQANFLLGLIQMYNLKDFGKAEQCFDRVLECDLNFTDVYKYYSMLKIWKSDFDGAMKLIKFGLKVPGMDVCTMLMIQAMVYECKGDFANAKSVLKNAKMISLDTATECRIKGNLTRIKGKMKGAKAKTKSKKKGSKKKSSSKKKG